MKIDRNLRNGLPNLKFEESDLSDLAKVKEMFDGIFSCHKCGNSYENKGWGILKRYLQCERIKLEAVMKMSVSLNRINESESKVEVAKLIGFDHFLEMEDRILLKIAKIREESKKSEAEEHDEQSNEYGD